MRLQFIKEYTKEKTIVKVQDIFNELLYTTHIGTNNLSTKSTIFRLYDI